MAYRYGDRYQSNMFPQSIEEYVPPDDPVRAYDTFVEALNLKELGLAIDEDKEGNPQYDPASMVKLFLYGCSYGIRSSRKLERACYHNLSFIWLLGGLKPDHKTIAEFRKKNTKALSGIIKQCARLCIQLGLIEGNTLFVDGTKMRANAATDNTFTKERAEQVLATLDRRIEQLLCECDAADEQERGESSHIKLGEELKDHEARKCKIEAVLKELKETGARSINTTDSACVMVKGRQGIHAGYNAQITVDAKHALIVNSDVVAESSDINQFAPQIEQAEAVIGHDCKNACADAGYANTDNLKRVHDRQVTVIVPTKDQANERTMGPFAKERFTYDEANDCYRCPEGHTLPYSSFEAERNCRIYRIADKKLCRDCKHYGACTWGPGGRRIRRLVNEPTKIALEKIYTKASSQQIFALRKAMVEHPFGHLKHNLGITSFLLRGVDAVKAEMSIMASCINMSKLITICCGVESFIARLSTV